MRHTVLGGRLHVACSVQFRLSLASLKRHFTRSRCVEPRKSFHGAMPQDCPAPPTLPMLPKVRVNCGRGINTGPSLLNISGEMFCLSIEHELASHAGEDPVGTAIFPTNPGIGGNDVLPKYQVIYELIFRRMSEKNLYEKHLDFHHGDSPCGIVERHV